LGQGRAVHHLSVTDEFAGLKCSRLPAWPGLRRRPLLAELIRRWAPTSAYVEYVGARPGEAPRGGFAFGRSRGAIEDALGAAGVPVRFLTPPTWKRAVGISPGREGAKDLARSEAIRRWPTQAALFARKSDDGRAEAALIAIAGMIRHPAMEAECSFS
jgi:crossover junction endodeoxyribonuclease RuvC